MLIRSTTAFRHPCVLPNCRLARRSLLTSSGSLAPLQLEGGRSSPSAYCSSLVRNLDHEAWLTSYFWPPGRQKDAFFAVRALNIELLNIQETISNPAIVRLRMQFWKDAVNAISNDNPPPSHPIALLLARTSTPSTRDLTAYYLNQIIEARVRTTSLHNSSFLSSFSLLSHPLFFVSQSSPPSPSLSLTALLTSLTKTSTPLHLLSLSLLSPPNSSSPNPPPHVTASLQHLSLASGLVALLRSLPRDAAQRRTLSVLPLDLCATHGLVTEDVYRLGGGAGGRLGEGGGGVKEVVWEVACRANDELATARKEWEEKGGVVPKEYRALFLSGIPTRSYLTRLEALAGDAFDPSLQQRHWRLPLDVWLGWRRGVF